ncbi:hypothetical protein VW29_04210 [Devosia limi DSM 17137]|uniref:Uncharacterized protein n=1 Tax=Devosia limi DSM 17137 TaxID=1121477 RepID=A0A0F5LWT3_9HYPH|nr:hypothetical protein [Devosia limi]KKB86092.1 hypothetical protein VW29_04210 [Devosia limi DSM 17137]
MEGIDEFYDDDGVAIWEFGHHKFDGYEDIPAASDGDYPPWIQSSMHEFIPRQLLERFGSRQSSAINGYFWFIGEDRAEELLNAIRGEGYSVAPGGDLKFF